MSQRMKPPARRAGRTLGGTEKAAPPPSPPAAELTPEQYAADQGEGRPPARESEAQPAPSPVPAEVSARDQAEAAPEVAQTSAQPTVEVTPSGPVPKPATSQPVRPAVVAPEAGTQSAGTPGVRQVKPVAPLHPGVATMKEPSRWNSGATRRRNRSILAVEYFLAFSRWTFQANAIGKNSQGLAMRISNVVLRLGSKQRSQGKSTKERFVMSILDLQSLVVKPAEEAETAVSTWTLTTTITTTTTVTTN
ncbi:hypothetical protein OG562_05295 [Streptomyces sp. NBC_01275]|uniref:hypothetical protein n=1 Tax=Streptomyces sp. NBC_01275 TaxID=2903807 RepID=UPI0022536AB6|nr:hypothetical protein [Streptomyces sp. NBC_01275]MCX4760398.1 hypothetical protein [Streptomyces sp. NBC_01275]